jgi:hypothetical protein
VERARSISSLNFAFASATVQRWVLTISVSNYMVMIVIIVICGVRRKCDQVLSDDDAAPSDRTT